MSRCLFLVSITLLAFFTICFSAEFDFGDDSVESQEETKGGLTLPLRGKTSLELGVQTGSPARLIKAGPSLNGILDWHPKYGTVHSELTLRHNRAFRIEKDPPETVKNYENESILRELYIKKSIAEYTLTIGKVIVVWGKNDFLSVLDVVSPRDQTEYLFANPEEARLGQNLVKIERWFGRNHIDAIFSPKPSMNRNAGEGHPYSLFPEAGVEESPSGEFGIRWSHDGEMGEFAFMGGEFHERDPLFESSENLRVKKKVISLRMVGSSMVYVITPFLFRAEAGWFSDKPYQSVGGEAEMSIKTVETLAFSAGMDYNSERFGSITFEANYYLPKVTDLNVRRVSLFSISWQKNYFRDNLNVNITGIGLSSISDHLIRSALSCKLTDSIELTSQYTYIRVTGAVEEFRAVKDFDRFDIALSYSFDLEQGHR